MSQKNRRHVENLIPYFLLDFHVIFLTPFAIFQEPKEVHPLAPPPAHHAQKTHAHDPYLKTEAEVSNYDFSGPFFYSSTKNIIRKEKKDGKPKTGAEHGHEKIHEKPGAPHTYYRYY